MKASILILFLFFTVLESSAQGFQLINSVEIKEPTQVSIDRSGNIYFSTFQGDIIKYNPPLENKYIFSPNNPNTTTVLEAWQGLRIFSFHRDLQQYRLINRNLSLNEDYSFPSNQIGFAEMATPSFDNNIWVIDQIDFSLKKYDLFINKISSRTPLNVLLDPDNYEILHCKEYQNRLFVSTRNYGILIFDNFGNHIKTYENKGVTFFNFWKDTLYFMEDNTLVKINLYKEEMTFTELPSHASWLFALIYKDKIYLLSKYKLILYK